MSGDEPRASIGQYLARQRRLRGISVDELCDLTKIPRRNIERLEAGALDGVHDGFVRGFVRTVANALGLDADEAVMRLMQEPTATADPGPAPRVLTVEQLRWAGVALTLLVLLLVWKLATAWWESRPAPPPEAPLLHRRDAIGELVRERAAQPPPAAAEAEAEAEAAPRESLPAEVEAAPRESLPAEAEAAPRE